MAEKSAKYVPGFLRPSGEPRDESVANNDGETNHSDKAGKTGKSGKQSSKSAGKSGKVENSDKAGKAGKGGKATKPRKQADPIEIDLDEEELHDNSDESNVRKTNHSDKAGKTGKYGMDSAGSTGKNGKDESSDKVGKGGKGGIATKPPTRAAPVEINLAEIPKNARCLMNCEAANMLEDIEFKLHSLSGDPAIKKPQSFDKGLLYAKSCAKYTKEDTVKQFRAVMTKYNVPDAELCLIGNVCPEKVEEVYALVPSMKTKQVSRTQIKCMLAELAKLKATK